MNKEEILYHYTSISGLNGIISSHNVWASDCRFLNDQNELDHAIDLFKNRFEGEIKGILSLALDWHSFSRAHCVFSLSRSPKILSQWRAYGDDGRGAAIGFSRSYLSKTSESYTSLIVDCIYEDINSFIDELVKNSQKEIDELHKIFIESEGAVNIFWNLIDKNPKPLSKIYSQLLRAKNPAFQEEKEVRLIISTPIKNVLTRVSNGLIIPYIAHPIIREGDDLFMHCIAREIWFGPKCDKRNIRAVHAFRQFSSGVPKIQQYECGYI